MEYILSLGSNIDDRKKNLEKAISELNIIGEVEKKSSIYESKPYGVTNQFDFFNALCIFKFKQTAFRLLRKIKQIEVQIGRTRNYRWGPRKIDIDIIDWNGPVINTQILKIPHFDFKNRAFVLKPLSEIMPDYQDRNGVFLAEFLEALDKKDMVLPCREQW